MPHPELTEEPLGEDAMYVAVPEGRQARTVRDLSDAPWALEARGGPARQWALDVCRRSGFEPRAAHETSDVIVQCTLAAHGTAAAFIPGLTPQHLTSQLKLLALPVGEARTLSIATRTRSATDLRVRAVVAAIRAELHSEPSSDALGPCPTRGRPVS